MPNISSLMQKGNGGPCGRGCFHGQYPRRPLRGRQVGLNQACWIGRARLASPVWWGFRHWVDIRTDVSLLDGELPRRSEHTIRRAVVRTGWSDGWNSVSIRFACRRRLDSAHFLADGRFGLPGPDSRRGRSRSHLLRARGPVLWTLDGTFSDVGQLLRTFDTFAAGCSHRPVGLRARIDTNAPFGTEVRRARHVWKLLPGALVQHSTENPGPSR